MKLVVPTLALLRRRLPVRRPCVTVRRCTTTNNKSGPNAHVNAHANSVSSVRSVTPGTVRVRRGTDPRAQEVEMDTTISRMMGSDWGDRSKQSVSLPMRIYWGIFLLVLANGAYTYIAGKDETFLVDKVQKKVDEKLGRVETNEFVVMADTPAAATETNDTEDNASVATPATTTTTAVKAAPVATDDGFRLEDAAPKSVFSSSTAPTPLPFFTGAASSTQRPTTKADYERQLQQLRERQARARDERNDPSRFRSVDEIDREIKRIDQQKAHVKQILKTL